jgi:xanthine dehydrogenase accessory factor
VKDILPDLDQWRSQGEEIALATLVRVQRSAPRLAGARLIVTRTGLMAGSVTSGCVEADVFARALQVLDSGTPAVASYGIADELGFKIGLSCGGSVDVLVEPFPAGEDWNSL